ncbi:hypothetical protein JGH11_12650 [Dysgonomonas sp. Marseille-P4677]|uniref:hypothetical protein n=1 Tax=Dysgonomonas sp. Marseille-P4677 TaxID=2364790 RepID=UPI001914AD84|nr:hypothetical protein [Dysgonomonas sp. Marseille-P4677]MBK5721721.1 hypothetical protein [Dysgonomonas sp. Marseille-P4677]
MKTDEIKLLIEAFYNGETNAEEEQILLNYFSSEDIAEELLNEKDLFLQMCKKEPIDIPSDLESKLGKLIDELDKNERIQINTHKPRINRLIGWVAGAAACIAILVSITFYFNQKPNVADPSMAGTHDQLETLSSKDKETLKEAEDALILLSSKFNKGIDQLAVVSNNLDKTNELLNKTLKRKKDKES